MQNTWVIIPNANASARPASLYCAMPSSHYAHVLESKILEAQTSVMHPMHTSRCIFSHNTNEMDNEHCVLLVWATVTAEMFTSPSKQHTPKRPFQLWVGNIVCVEGWRETPCRPKTRCHMYKMGVPKVAGLYHGLFFFNIYLMHSSTCRQNRGTIVLCSVSHPAQKCFIYLPWVLLHLLLSHLIIKVCITTRVVWDRAHMHRICAVDIGSI